MNGFQTTLRRRSLASLWLFASLATFAGTASAHADYVTEGDGAPTTVADLLAGVFGDPLAVALLAGGAVAGLVAVLAYLAVLSRVPDVAVARSTLASYRPYLSWMLRLSVGIPLVGAGFGGYLYSPSVPVEFRLFQVGVGFLLLFGLAVRPVAFAGLVGYGITLALHPEALLAFELAGGLAALVLAGPGQPSADMLLQRLSVSEDTYTSRLPGIEGWLTATLDSWGLGREWVPVVLRVTMGLAFVYLGVTQKWLAPGPALAVVDKYALTALVPVSPLLWVFGAGLVEAVVGLALLSGAFTRGAAGLAFLMLTLTLFGLPDDPVVAHVSLFGLCSALLVTGGGRYSLDAAVVPALRERVETAAMRVRDPTPS